MIFLISYLICSGNSEKKITVKVFELAKHSLNLYRSYYFHKLSDSVNLWKNEAFHVQRVQSSRRKKLFEKHSSYIAACIVLAVYACCVVAGRADQIDEFRSKYTK